MKKDVIDQKIIAMLLTIILFLIVFIVSIATSFNLQTVSAVSSDKQKEAILVKSYEMTDNKGYPVSNSNPVSKMCFGRSSIGSLYLEASKIVKTSNNNFIVSPDVSFYYDLTDISLNNLGNGWTLSNDSANSIDKYYFNSQIESGGLMLSYKYSDTNIVFKSQNNVLAGFFNKKNNLLEDTSRQNLTEDLFSTVGINAFIFKQNYLKYAAEVIKIIADLYKYSEIEHKFNFRLGYEVMTYDKKNYRNLVEDYNFTITINDSLAINDDSKAIEAEYNNASIIESSSYNFPDKKKYARSNNPNALTQMLPYGLHTAGKLKINGTARKSLLPNGATSYFVKNAITLSYEDICLRNNRFNNTTWELSSDGDKGYDNIDGTIGLGVLNIQKRQLENDSWNVDTINMSNVFNAVSNNKTLTYTPSIDDLRTGVELTIRIAYEIRNTQTGEYRNIMEYYHFVLISEESITFHNLSINDAMYGELVEDVNFDIYKKGETLVDGSVTRRGFRVDFNQNSPTVKVIYSYNNGDYTVLKNGTKFTSQGKYRFFIITMDGKIARDVTIYIDREDISDIQRRYIGDNPFDIFLNGQRLFDAKYAIPVYSTLSPMLVEHTRINKMFPMFYYAITENGETPTEFIKFDTDISFEMQPNVVYTLYLRNMVADATPGDHIVFTLQWTAQEREAIPTLNYNNYTILLNNATSRENLKDRFYQVKARSENSVGAYYFVFDLSSYESALNFAIELEKHSVKEQDGLYIYKGVGYTSYDLSTLKTHISENARLNVEEAYFIDSITLSDKKVDDVLTTSTDKDLYVFPDEVEKTKMLTSGEYPYGNNFEFVSAGEFESSSVFAELVYSDDENAMLGRRFIIPYNTKLEDVLPFNGLYTITEKNKYDNERSFTLYIVHNNTSMFSVYDGDNYTTLGEFGGDNVGKILNIETESEYVLLDGGATLDPYFKTYIDGKLYFAEDIRAANIKLYPNQSYNIVSEDRFGHKVSNVITVNKKNVDSIPSDVPNLPIINEKPGSNSTLPSENLEDTNIYNNGDTNGSNDNESNGAFVTTIQVLTDIQIYYIKIAILIAIGAVALIAMVIIACLIWSKHNGGAK